MEEFAEHEVSSFIRAEAAKSVAQIDKVPGSVGNDQEQSK
jgi:hypothetical protein